MTATRVLVMEDERILALHMRQQLSKLGYDVVAMASSGARALEKIVELRPDVALMDIHVEGDMDGIETASRIPPELAVPVIYITAYSEESTLERARATRPYGYIIKPFSERELHATIQMALERRRSEQAMRISEDRFRSIFAAIGDGVFLVDATTGCLLDVNEAGYGMFGFEPGELLGRQVEALSSGEPPYTQREARHWHARAAEAETPLRFEWHCRAKDGRLFWADVSIRAVRIGGERMVLAIVRDLTERHVLEARLGQAQRMEALGQLTGGMAHDFNNVLGVVVGNLDLLRRLVADQAMAAELCDEALDGATRCGELIRRLLAFARRQPLHPQPVDVTALVSDIARLLARTLGEDVRLVLNLAPVLPPVLVDPSQLEAALVNLANNARDAMPRGGTLEVITRATRLDDSYAKLHADVVPGEYVMIEVSDSGVGIAPAIIGRIFDPFFTTKGPDGGSGLGLSMTYGFVKQSAGHIAVYSEPGLGTAFRLYFPRASEDAGPSGAPALAAPVAGGSETILLVEDNTQLRRATQRLLDELGYRVVTADDAGAAMAVLNGEDPVDLLFSDVVMPGPMNGVELARAGSALRPGLRVLLTSGFSSARAPEDRAAEALLPRLDKPYRRDQLAAAVRAALDDGPVSLPE